MRESPPFRYYGGKWRAAMRYPAPKHDHIVEPFAGGAGYSLRYWWLDVTLRDVDATLIRAWHWLQESSARDVMLLGDVRPGMRADEVSACDGARAFATYNTNNASARGRPTFTERAAKTWNRCRVCWSRWPDRVRHWNIYADNFDAVHDEVATWFIDAPYSTPAGAHYRAAALDYDALAVWCQSRRGQVTVCEQAGATWLPFQPFGHVKGQAKHGTNDRNNEEVVWNGR